MPEKFFLISQVFYPDQVSTGNLFTDLCSVIAEKGTEVEVWAAQPSYTESKRKSKVLNYKGIKIKFLPSTNFRKTNLPGRIINTITFSVSAGVKILFSRDKTPVWTHTTPPFLGILLSFICSLRNRKFVYVLLDIFPEGLIRLGKVSRHNLFVSIWQWFFLKSLQNSNWIVTIGRDMHRWISEICTSCERHSIYIPLWQNEDLLFPVKYEENSFVREKGLSNRFVVQYSGNMGLWNELETIGKVVNKGIGNVKFIFVGNGRRKKELIREFLPGNNNVMILPFQPNESFNSVLSASHAHLVSLKKGLESIAVPSKIYGIMAASRPVIALVPKNSEISYIINEENCGIVVEPTDQQGLINAINLLKENHDLRTEMGNNSRKAFKKKYTSRIIAERYISLLNDLNSGN